VTAQVAPSRPAVTSLHGPVPSLSLLWLTFYMDILGAARFDFQIYSDGAQEAVAAGRAIIISTAGCMIASSSAFWWCSGFSFHDETAVANVGSLYHRATTYNLELCLPTCQDSR